MSSSALNITNPKSSLSNQRQNDLVIGMITGVNQQGLVYVAFAQNQMEEPVISKTVVPVSNEDMGRRAVIMFEGGNMGSPVVLGLIQDVAVHNIAPESVDAESNIVSESIVAESTDTAITTVDNKASFQMQSLDETPDKIAKNVRVDTDTLLVQSVREIHLECGESSISMTRAGKIVIKGMEIETRSAGCNRIKGVSVDIN